jgi:hypothetical protein
MTHGGRWVRCYGFLEDEGRSLFRRDVFREVHPVRVVNELAHFREYLDVRFVSP